MSDTATVIEDKRVACRCRIDPDTPENICAYTIPPQASCPSCRGTGWRTRRTTYDRKLETFAKILHQEWI